MRQDELLTNLRSQQKRNDCLVKKLDKKEREIRELHKQLDKKCEEYIKVEKTPQYLLMGEVVRLRRAMEYDQDIIKGLTKRAEKAEHELAKLKAWVKVKKIPMKENYD